MPSNRLSEIIQTSAAVEAGLDPVSIGYKAPIVAAMPATKIARADLNR